MKEPLDELSRLLNQFRRSPSRTMASKDLRDFYGKDWRDAVAQLQLQGYLLEQILGGNGNISYRLDKNELGNMIPKADQRVTLSRFDDPNDPLMSIRLRVSDMKAMLRQGVPPTVRDVFVGAVMRYEEGDGH